MDRKARINDEINDREAPFGALSTPLIPAKAGTQALFVTDVYSSEKRSAVMRRIKGKNTSPELAVRKALTRLGARYRLHRAELPGKPDIVLPGRKLVLFIHGCFWHGHDCARGARVPKQNRDYWVGKVARNRARDANSREALAALGWRVETIWECDLKDAAALDARLAHLLRCHPGKSRQRLIRDP